jgi:predicted  nucleic acid-binding Zn-ribbon protein
MKKKIPDDLNKIQKIAYNAMMDGKNVFLSGAAGTGKSYVIRKFIHEKQKSSIIVCAPTGIAALNIDGCTIHRLFGFGITPTPFSKPYRGPASEALMKSDILVIDEISMCRADLFERCAKAIRWVEEKTGQKKQIIVVGDFHQLPPVLLEDDKRILPELDEGTGYGFAFEAPSWTSFNFNPIVLTEIVRQADKDFANALNAVRIGDAKGLEWITEHSSKSEMPDGIGLCGNNKIVKEINDMHLGSIAGKTYTYQAIQNGTVAPSDKIAPDILNLKKGVRVIALINNPNRDFQNGSIGTVQFCSGERITVAFDNGKTVDVVRHKWSILNFVYNKKENRVISNEIGSYEQFPLKLAYAITIHKSQGQTYDAVNFYPACFAPGQLYVGLSRCKTIGKLHLMAELKPENMIVCQAIRDFYDNPSGDYTIHYNDNVIHSNTGEAEEHSPAPAEESSKSVSVEEKKQETPEPPKPMKANNNNNMEEKKKMTDNIALPETTAPAAPAKPVTMQIRADEQTRERFAEICKSMNMTQGAAMQQLIHAYEMDAAKGTLAGSADVIDDVRSHMDAITNAFLVQLERTANTDQRVRADYDNQIQTLTTALQDAQSRIQQAQETAAQAQAALDAIKEQAAQESKDAAAQVATYMEQAEHAKKEAETERQAAADARETAKTFSAHVGELTADRDRLRAKAERADSLAAELAQARSEIARLNTAAEVAKAQAEAAQAKAVADAEKGMQTKLDALRNEMQGKLDVLQCKLDNAKDELSKTKDKLHEVLNERDELARKIPQQTKSGNE